MGNTQTVYLPPWEPTTDEERARAEEYTQAVRSISTVPRHFVEPDPVVDSPDFPFDWETHRAFAESAYRNDTRLHKLLPRLVPKHVTEEVFWRNYFSHVFAIKCRFAGKQVAPPAAPAEPTAPDGGEEEPQLDDASTRLARAASLTSQLAYPERFELALKYVREGPSLPHDAAPGDRILMDVLSQQATIGQCNTPRPGMWDSAEAKARHEAWVKLGSMSKHEAMHLYVQALEIFRKDWVLWEGLQITADMIKRADAVSTPKREPSGNGGGGSVSASGRAAAAASPQLSPPPAVTVPNGSASPAAPNGSVPPSAAPGEGETLFLLDISPSSRALSMLLELLPATRHIAVVSVARIADLPEPVQKGCAKLPLLVNPSTGFELWDAHAIMGYLAQKYAPQLPNGMAGADFAFPTDPEGSAMIQQFLAYRQATLWPAVRDHVFAQLFPASPVCPVTRGPALREYVENAERRLQMELNRLNTVFLEQTPFLVGDKPSAADVSCACAVSLLDWVSSPRVEQYPNLAVWFTAVARLPGYKQSARAHRQFAVTPNDVQQGHFALALIE